MRMLTKKLARDLWSSKGQVITIALVVASGVAAFCASLSTYESLRAMQAGYYDTARFAHVFAAARRVPNSIAPRLLELPGVVDAETTLAYDVLLTRDDVLEPMIARIHASTRRFRTRCWSTTASPARAACGPATVST
jgi:putative ABC transport system permease protein